jgi:adenosylhomocysteinase
MSNIRDFSLAEAGNQKIDWAARFMPLLASIKKRFAQAKPFEGCRIAMSIHLEAKTACLAKALQAGGARVFLTGCNPLSTQDDVAAALACQDICVNALHGADENRYTQDLIETLKCRPHAILDDGGDFTALLHGEYASLAQHLIGGCEETTTGINRLRVRQAAGKLNFPMIAVNDADCKHLFDNRYGTGQSVLTAIMHVTNLSVASRVFVVAGYGWCGKGVARRAQGMGARVIVTEIDAVRALEAVMDGFEVMPMAKAAVLADVVITVTGCRDILNETHFAHMKNDTVLCNAGHFDVEINKDDLLKSAKRVWQSKPDITSYEMPNGRTIHLLAQGRLVNLAAGMGHPIEIMDMSFALQALCIEHLIKNGNSLEKKLYPVPRSIDIAIAGEKLETLGTNIDCLTDKQMRYNTTGGL